ncbi:MAG: DUF5777 family beta-barrel protein [Bacteroidia bacterium]|nr:DUF5777 family beta-barrel protein [Bacteroidia bacterium]
MHPAEAQTMDRYRISPITLLGIAPLLLAQPPEEKPEPVIATFKGTRLYNFHTSETPAHRHLEFRVAHRFGDLRQGYANFFGIDAGATVRISLGYGVLPWAEIGLERTGAGKWWNGYTKLRLLRQTAPRGMPISLTYIGMAFLTEATDPLRYRVLSDRWEYLHQLLIARKFSRRFSVLMGAAWLHQNMSLTPQALNDWLWALGGLRFKLFSRVTLIAEGALPLWKNALSSSAPFPNYHIPWSIGTEIETGGHVFQLGLTSAAGLSENQVLLTDRPLLRLGFNISRIFSLQGGPTYGKRE